MKLKNNRKIIVNCIASLAVLLLCIFLLPMSVFADSQGTVNDNNVNIRSQADASSTSLGKVNSGDKVTILEEVTNSSNVVWYKIQTAAGTTGYIRSDFITKAAATGNDNTPSTGTAPTPDTNTTTTTTTKTPTVTNTDPKAAYISGDVVNIRSQASASSDLIAKAQKNTEVTVTGEVTASDGYKWYKVTFSADGGSKTGFIRSDLLTFTKPTNTPAETNIDSTTTDPATTDNADPDAGTAEDAPSEETANTDADKPAETTEPKRTISPLQPSGEPSVIPDGFNEVSLETGEKVWNKGDYYIIYGMNEKETIGWYVLDEKNSTYISYDGFLEKSTASKKGDVTKIFGINIKVILVILIVLVIVLLGVVFFMALKLSRGVENDDDYDYDDYEDEEDDEEDIPVSSIENSRRSRGRREREPEPEEEYEEKEPVRSKASRAKDKFLNYFTNEVDDEGDDDEYYDDVDEEDDDIDFIDI